MNIVLLEPEIPPNTGNIARLCAATRSTLHLIEPLGFEINDRQLARAGMDYWKLVTWQRWASWKAFSAALPPSARLWMIEQGAPRSYVEACFQPQTILYSDARQPDYPPDCWRVIARRGSIFRCLIRQRGRSTYQTVSPLSFLKPYANLVFAPRLRLNN